MKTMKLGWSLCGGFNAKRVSEPTGVNAFGKPMGGIWLSPFTETGTEWTDFCKIEEMNFFLQNAVVYPVTVDKKGLYCFRSEPTPKKVEKILKDDSYRGFYIKNVYSGWDVPTVWVKSLSDITFLKEQEMVS